MPYPGCFPCLENEEPIEEFHWDSLIFISSPMVPTPVLYTVGSQSIDFA